MEKREETETAPTTTTSESSVEAKEVAQLVNEMIEATESLKMVEEEQKEKGVVEDKGGDPSEEDMLNTIKEYLQIVMLEKDKGFKRSQLLKNYQVAAFLVVALTHQSMKVVEAAIGIINILMTMKSNYPTLQKVPYLLDSLEKISRRKKYPEDVRRDAANIIKILKDAKQPLQEQSRSVRNHDAFSKEVGDTATLRKAKQRGRETILQLYGGVLRQDQYRKLIEKTLIKVQGIISLTYDLAKDRCVIRGKHNVDPDAFGRAVAKLGIKVSRVAKNELQNEELIPVKLDTEHYEDNAKENTLPDYLPEEDCEISATETAVVRQGQTENPKQGSSYFNSAVNFVRTSFYW